MLVWGVTVLMVTIVVTIERCVQTSSAPGITNGTFLSRNGKSQDKHIQTLMVTSLEFEFRGKRSIKFCLLLPTHFNKYCMEHNGFHVYCNKNRPKTI